MAVDDTIDRHYQSTWYRLRRLSPGDDVTVALTNCAVDFTLLGYADVRQKALELLGLLRPPAVPQVEATLALQDQQRLLTGDTAADDMDSDDMDSDDMDSDDMDSDDMDSDDMDSDDMDSDDMDSDDMDSDDMDSDDMDSDGVPDVRQFADVYASAQRRALRSASVTPGPADEAIYTTVRVGGTGDLYFRVRGHRGAFSSRPFTITATVTHADLCDRALLQPVAPAIPNVKGKTTLILTHSRRPSLGLKSDEERRSFLKALRRLEGPTSGYVHDLADDANLAPLYVTWDDVAVRCVAQANAIVRSIRRLVDELATTNPIEYVVIAGGDDVIPFMRVIDGAEISREWKWTGPYRRETALDASLAQGFFLSDDAYGSPYSFSRHGRSLYLPTRAVSRLVESAADITSHVDWYLGGERRPGKDGVELRRALVTGYDFVRDLADALALRLVNAGADVDRALVSDQWSADDLRRTLFGPSKKPQKAPFAHYDLIAAQGHYSATTLVPADRTERFRSREVRALANGDLAGTVWATIGCHSGHHIVDREATPHAEPGSFVEIMLSKGATVIAGTSYQYGETVLLKNSERLYQLFVDELTTSVDPKQARQGVTVGRALVNAKRRYANELLTIRGIDEKAIGVATLYGLPMLEVRARRPLERAATPRADFDLQPTDTTGLQRATFEIRGYSIDRFAEDGTARALAVDGLSVAPALRPALPAIYRDVTVAGRVAVGVVWLEGEFVEQAQNAVIVRAATERSGVMPHYRNRAFLPVRPIRLERFEQGRQTLLFAPMQYRSGDPVGTVRLWSAAKFAVYYSSRTDAGTVRDAPALRRSSVTAIPGGVRLRVDLRHRGSLGEELHVFASYLDGTTLRSVEMNGGASWSDGIGFARRFRRDVPGDPTKLRFFFQAVGDNGRVGVLSGGGRGVAVEPPIGAAATQLALDVNPGATFRERVDVRATLRDANGSPMSGREILLRLGPARLWVMTDSAGVARARLVVAVRPRATRFTVVASYMGAPDASASEDSRGLEVKLAPTTFDRTPKTLTAGAREIVGKLKLQSSGLGLGERPIRVTRDKFESWVEADPDGSVQLSPTDIGDPVPGAYDVRLDFRGDDRYEASTATVGVTVV